MYYQLPNASQDAKSGKEPVEFVNNEVIELLISDVLHSHSSTAFLSLLS